MRFFQNANYPFLAWRQRGYVLTALLLVATVAAVLMNHARLGTWLNYGVDFTGGAQVQLQFRQAATVAEIRQTVTAAGHGNWQVTSFGGENEFLIRLPSAEFSGDLANTVTEQVTGALSARYAESDFVVGRTEAVSPKVGDEMQMRALWAILFSLVATALYLWFRFEWRFGIAAVVATIHDIVITLGILAMLRSEISLGTVAAFLTIVGYSLNDTIVLFDRIRENLGKPRHGRSFFEILNQSINEVLPRTLITSGTTVLTLMSLVVLGGPVIFDFALVLVLGVLIGTYSSIFVAAPVLLFIEDRWPHKPPPRETAVRATSRNRAPAGA